MGLLSPRDFKSNPSPVTTGPYRSLPASIQGLAALPFPPYSPWKHLEHDGTGKAGAKLVFLSIRPSCPPMSTFARVTHWITNPLSHYNTLNMHGISNSFVRALP